MNIWPLTDLDLHLHDVILGGRVRVFHDLIQQDRLDLKVRELADVTTAQDGFLVRENRAVYL